MRRGSQVAPPSVLMAANSPPPVPALASPTPVSSLLAMKICEIFFGLTAIVVSL
jgi:hypothetical protein